MSSPPPPLFDLDCVRCRAPYPEHGLPPTCPACGGFWTHGDRFAWRPPVDAAGLGAWSGALGLDPSELPDRAIGRPPVPHGGVLLLRDGSAPKGSFKERGAEVLLAACARRGIREVFLDSSGNAGVAAAKAATDRGIACRVLVPETTPSGKLDLLEEAGARVEVVPGDRQATHRAALARIGERIGRRIEADAGAEAYASHIVQPFFHAGVATLAWDLDRYLRRRNSDGEPDRERESSGERRDGTAAPIDRVLLPAGQGSLLLGIALGLERLVRAGRLPRMPRLHVVQLAGYASLAPGGPGRHEAGAPPDAAGIAVTDPPRREDMAAWIERTGGDVTVVTDREIARARQELRQEGFHTDPTGAAAWALLAKRPELAGEGTVAVLTSVEEP